MQVKLIQTVSLHFAIYTGSCDSLVCAGSRFVGFLPFTWDTVEGELYSIFVYGSEHALPDFFGIVVEEVERPANDGCSAAIPLELNDVTTGTTMSSLTEEGLILCGDFDGEVSGG